MKKFLCFFCMCFFLSFHASAEVDQAMLEHALNAPDSISQNIRRLTNYLIKPYKKDYDKLKVIAYWMATHIAYDNYRYDNDKSYTETNKYTYDILKVKTGICSDFARLFKEMATVAGVKNVSIISGKILNTKEWQRYYIPSSKPKGHAWNEAFIDGRHFYIDTTWMSSLHIGHDDKRKRRKNIWKYKRELYQRKTRETKVSKDIDDFYFDFNPQEEVEKRHIHHWTKNQFLKNFRHKKKDKKIPAQKQTSTNVEKGTSEKNWKSKSSSHFTPKNKEFSQRKHPNQQQNATRQEKPASTTKIRKALVNERNVQQQMIAKQHPLKPSQVPANNLKNQKKPEEKKASSFKQTDFSSTPYKTGNVSQDNDFQTQDFLKKHFKNILSYFF